MEYNEILRCRCSLQLATGRLVILNKLIQSRHYSQMFMGLPNKRSNDLHIEWLLREARNAPGSIGEPLLIPPARRHYQYKPGDMDRYIGEQRNLPEEAQHLPEWLPTVASIGRFDSHTPSRDKTQHASSLTIAWFQDDYGLDPQISEQLKLVDWDQHAVDFQY